MVKVKSLVIGGGPSGLALAFGLQGDTLILEKEGTVGGLCRSFHYGCGVFDIGGHSFHTPYPAVYELIHKLTSAGLYTQTRDARIYTHRTLIPYPFQKFYDQIPSRQVVAECDTGLRSISTENSIASNLQDQIVGKFGLGIAKHFMLPYNRKLWARDIKEISCEWTSERVAAPKGQIQRFETTGGSRQPLQSDTQVSYPLKGGFEELFRNFVPLLPGVEVNSQVVSIDPYNKVAVTEKGDHYTWDYLVSTIPLPMLTRLVEGTPDEVTMMADRLQYMSLRVELLLTDKPLDTPIQRIYIADPNIPPHKIALNHNSSDYLRQKPQHAIMAEVSISSEKRVDVDQIASKTIALLCEMGILSSPESITWRGHIDVDFAYPVYTHERPSLVKAIKDWMADRHIYTLGRFGDWEYINSDKCIMKGLNLASELHQKYS